MAVELRPLGVTCNIRCSYCYQNPQRDAGNGAKRYDLEAMKDAVAAAGGPFTLFGGEPLLLPHRDLEELLAWGYETYGGSGIQTNGTLIDDEHVRMFRRYRVAVGISVDGPAELNAQRRAGGDRATAERTEETHRAIARLCREGLPPALIVTLHRTNAAADRLPRMAEWLRGLDAMGVRRVRLHVLEWEETTGDPQLPLAPEENVAALLFFARLERQLPNLRFDLFSEMRALLAGEDRDVSCVWHPCDPYSTPAVQGVEGFGQRSNCGRTNKDGVEFVKAAVVGHERQVVLYSTPQEDLGCQDCRFFLVCKGNCPGTASGGDWRNRSEHCTVWMRLFEHFEGELEGEGVRPLSRHPLRQAIERELVAIWARGGDDWLADVETRVARRAAAGEPLPDGPPPLPSFCRVSWSGDAARRVWQPRFEAIRRAWRSLAVECVARGLRSAALVAAPAGELTGIGELAARRGLACSLIGVAVPPAEAAAEATPPAVEDWLSFRLAICRHEDAAVVRLTASESGRPLDGPLAPPPCCAAAAAGLAAFGDPSEDVEWWSNGLLLRLGLSLLPWVPCSEGCADSRDLAQRMLALAESAAPQETAWLREILSWPMAASTRNGVLEVKTPVLKLIADDRPPARQCLRFRPGSSYPAEGARGIRFPFDTSRRRRRAGATATTALVSIGSGGAPSPEGPR